MKPGTAAWLESNGHPGWADRHARLVYRIMTDHDLTIEQAMNSNWHEFRQQISEATRRKQTNSFTGGNTNDN